MGVPARILNDLFATKVGSAEGREKVAEHTGLYIRDRLRELSFTDHVIPPVGVTRADCQVSVNHDTLVKIVTVEPKSRAMALTFRGQPEARFIRAPRAEIPFFTISSEKFEKTEQELMVYDAPITKIIEDNTVKDIAEILDREFTIHVESAVQAQQAEANGGSVTTLNASAIQSGSVVEFKVIKGELARAATTNNGTVLPGQKPDYVNLFKLLDGNRFKAVQILLTEPDWDDLLQWTLEDVGGKVLSETTIEGYKYNLIMGRQYIRTVKTDILRPGNVYVFASSDFVGRNYILNNTKFYIDKIANLITWQSWKDVAVSIVNIAACAKLELYSGDATLNDANGILSGKIPMSEEDLGAENNRVDSGLVYPSVEMY